MTYSSEWYQSVLNAMDDMVLVKGPDSHLLWANAAFRNYYGMSEDELHSIIDADHSDPDNTLQYVRDDLTVVETGQSLDISEEAVTDAAGDTRLFHTIKSPVFEDQTVVRTVGVSRLLDNATIAKRDIKHTDAKAFAAPIKALTGSFPNPMLMVDVRMRVVSVSPLWTRHFGEPSLSPESHFWEVYPDMLDVQQHLSTCLETKCSVEQELEHRGADGKTKVYNVRICPWHYHDGGSGGATVVATDITALHTQKTELRKANDELLQFSYRASHDLKGPLSTAKGMAKFIAMDIEDGALDDAKQNADKIVEMMSKLEDTVLSFLSLATADGLDSQTEQIDLKAVVDDIQEGLGSMVQSLNAEVQTDLHVQHFASQSVRIKQIIENLVANGLKYSDPEEVHKWVRIASRITGNGQVQITVEDNGCGIAANHRGQVFDLFTRFDTKSDGTGLGLAIVKRHVDAMGGQIHVADTGNGTRFTVTLPSALMEAAE